MSIRCAIFGHRFPEVEDIDKSLFLRVDCERDGCDYAMDAKQFKAVLDELPANSPLRRDLERKGPKFI